MAHDLATITRRLLRGESLFFSGAKHRHCLKAIHVMRSRPLMTINSSGAVRVENYSTQKAWSRRVMVVDDHPDTADIIAMLLTRIGHVVRTAYRGTEAMEMAAAFEPHLAIIDLRLPDISGYDVAYYLRGQFGDPVQLIALSGCDIRARSRAHAFDQHVMKPVDAATLSRMIAKRLDPDDVRYS